MAFNSIPTSLAEMRKVAGSSIDKKYVRGIISFYRKVRETHGVDNPLASVSYTHLTLPTSG